MKIQQLNRKPRKGDRIGFGVFAGSTLKVIPPTKATYTVVRCDGNLCWQLADGQDQAQPFIWWFESDNTYNLLAHLFIEEVNDSRAAGDQTQGCVSVSD